VKAAPAAPPPPVDVTVSLGAEGSVGSSPGPAVGGTVGIGLGYRSFALYVEGRADAPASLEVAGGTVRTNLLLGSVVPCWRWRHFDACASLGIGALQAEGQLAFGQRQSTTLVEAGFRFQYAWMPFRHAGLAIHADVDAIPSRVTIYADGVPVWSTGAIAADLGLGIVGLF
jgi:hypothetical protein